MDWQNWLGTIADMVQIGSAIPLIVGAVYFFIRGRQLERRLKQLAQARSARPVALAVGLGNSNAGAVRQHLKRCGAGSGSIRGNTRRVCKSGRFSNGDARDCGVEASLERARYNGSVGVLSGSGDIRDDLGSGVRQLGARKNLCVSQRAI